MKNFIVIALTIVLASAMIFLGVNAYRGQRADLVPAPADNAELIGGQTDEHGCLIAAGYSWCEAKQKCLRTWEEVCGIEPAESDIASMQQAFMAKYNKSADQVRVTVNMFDGNFAKGGVKFTMDGEFGEGGIFLAYKENGAWKLAFDGNGMYNCADMDTYGFPAEMIPDCAGDEVRAEVKGDVQLPNPASVYCEEQGGEVEMRTDEEGGQYGVCVFSNGNECDEWAFFRGECAK